MTSVRKALALSLAERYVLLVLGLAGNMLVARLLTPEQIGMYSVALAVIALAQVLRDFGIGSFLIQQRDLTSAHLQTAFGVSLIAGSVLFSLMTFSAPWIAAFYADPGVAGLLRICALNFLLLPFCTISLSLLRREMQFDRVAVANVGGTLAGLATTILLALQGWGASGLAIGSVCGNATTGLIAWWVRGTDRSMLRPAFSEWRSVLGFGGQAALANAVTSVAVNINDLAVGKLMGFGAVAIISRAQGLMALFHRDLMETIRGVAYPAFARGHREGADLEDRWCQSVGAVTVFAWPFYGFISLLALETLRLLFGPQWDSAAPLVPAFCMAGAAAATSNLIFPLLMASGRIDLVTRAEVVYQPLRALMLVAIVAWWESVLAYAIGFMIILSAQTPLAYWVKGLHLPTRWSVLLKHLLASVIVTAATLALPLAWSWHMGLGRVEPLPVWQTALLALVALIAWVIAIEWTGHPVSRDPLFARFMLHRKLMHRWRT